MSTRKVVLATLAGLSLSLAGTQLARADSFDDMRKEAAAAKAKEEAEEKAKADAAKKAEDEESAKKKAANQAEWDEAKKKAGALKEAMGNSKDTMGDALRAKMKSESPIEKMMREKREEEAKKGADTSAARNARLKALNDKYQKGGVKGLAVEGAKMVGDAFKKNEVEEPKERTLMDELKEQREKDKAKNGESLEEMMKRKKGN